MTALLEAAPPSLVTATELVAPILARLCLTEGAASPPPPPPPTKPPYPKPMVPSSTPFLSEGIVGAVVRPRWCTVTGIEVR